MPIKECSFPPCDRPVKCKGLCRTHYMQQYTGKPLSPIRPSPRKYAPGATCEFGGCENQPRSLDLCGGHHMQKHMGMELRPLKQKAKGHTCIVPGCERERHGNGYCGGHYLQVHRGETPGDIRQPPTGLKISPGTNGYLAAKVFPDHPFYPYAADIGKRMRRGLHHRLVMAHHLGRPLLSSETVHHKDGNRANNALENLELRHGNHGQGQRIICADCGSHNTRAISLRH